MKKSHVASLLLFAVLGCGGGQPPPLDPALVATATSPPPAVLPPVAGAAKEWSDAEAKVPVSSADPIWGDRTAPVTIVEFSDFQCPFCARLAPTLQQVKDEYGPSKVRVVWKNYPLAFHQNAKPASEAAHGVFVLGGSEAFWKFYDSAFRDQTALGREAYEDWATKAGVSDLDTFKRGLDDHTWAEKVEADMALGTSVGVRGTPATFVNGVLVSGAQPYADIKAVIDAEYAKAQAALGSGVSADRLYVTQVAANFQRAEQNDPAGPDTTTVFKVPRNGPARGGAAATALVTIVEFSDFQCPYCAKVEATLQQLQTKYGNDLRLVWKNEPLPFHANAVPAANLALDALAKRGEAGFWDAHDRLFAARSAGDLDDAALEAVGQALGLSAAATHTLMQGNKFSATLDADAAVADDFHASGTPHFFINGRRLVGAQREDAFTKIIDEELVKARALVAAGTAAADVYDALTKNGTGAPDLEKRSATAPARNAPWKGGAHAKVLVQVFSDFQCPFCARAEPTIEKAMQTYGNRIKLVWRNLPLAMHPDAEPAAEAAMEANKQGGVTAFWKIHDLMFADQKDLSRDTLDTYAKQLHLNMARWATALDASAHRAEIDADTTAAQGANISGTPAFLIGPYYVSGAQPFAKLKRVIDRALAEAGP